MSTPPYTFKELSDVARRLFTMEEKTTIGTLLRTALDENGYSMRHLSELTSIDTATISRIINGKRKANLHHLEQFSHQLNIPLTMLLQAEGYQSTSTYDELFHSTELLTQNISISMVETQLNDYKEIAQTTNGYNKIIQAFKGKMNSISGIGPLVDQLSVFFSTFKRQKGNPNELALIGAALLYFIVPVDLIPDYLFAIGYLDDAVAVKVTASALNKQPS